MQFNMDKISRKLLEAAKFGQHSILEETIRIHGFIPDAVDECGQNALHHAVVAGDADCVNLLLNLHCPLGTRDYEGRTPLFLACLKSAPINIIHDLLYVPTSHVNICENEGVSPLMIACENSNHKVVEALIQAGADLSIEDLEGRTALWYARKLGDDQVRSAIASGTFRNNYDIVSEMLHSDDGEKYLDHERCAYFDNCGWNLLHWAVTRNLPQYVDVCLKFGCDPSARDFKGRSVLHLACHFGAGLDIIKKLVDDISDIINDSDWSGVTPLMASCRIAAVDVVEALIQMGANVNLVDENNHSALWYAKYYNRMDLYVALLQAGANAKDQNLAFSAYKLFPITPDSINSYNNEGLTLLMRACRDGKINQTRILINNGANLELMDDGNHTALWYATRSGNEELCKLLIKAGADATGYLDVLHSARSKNLMELLEALEYGSGLYAADSWGNNALHWSAMKDYLESALFLLDAGVSTRARNKWGATPLYMACFCRSSVQLIKQLIKHDKESIDICTNNMRSPLMVACKKSTFDVVKVLIDANASVNCEDNEGRTPLFYAYASCQWTMYRYLLTNGANPVKGDMCLLSYYIEYILHHWNDEQSTIELLKSNSRQNKLSGLVYLTLDEIVPRHLVLLTLQDFVRVLKDLDQIVHFVGIDKSVDSDVMMWSDDVLTLCISCPPDSLVEWLCTQSAAIDAVDIPCEQAVRDLMYLSRQALRKALSANARCEKDFLFALNEMQIPKRVQNYIRYLH